MAPKNLTGVTFLGMPAISADDRYSVKLADGEVEGPMSSAEVAERLRAGSLDGTEMISKDGNFWIPMLSLPMFRDVIDELQEDTGSSTMFGGRLMMEEDGPRRQHAGPTRPAPLSQSGLGLAGGAPSGAWASLEDSGSMPAVSGRAMGNLGLGDNSTPGLSELPLPGGFAGGVATEDSGAMPIPQAPPRQAVSDDLPILAEPEQTPGLDRFGISSFTQDTSDDLPASRGTQKLGASEDPFGPRGKDGATLNLPKSANSTMQSNWDHASGGLPRSAQNEEDPFGWSGGLPQSAAGLPQSAAGLPQSAGGGLPQSAAGLPQSSAGLPQTAAGLPTSSAALPQSSSPSREPSRPPGTMAMGAFQASADLPASVSGTGDILENLGADASLWADDDVIPGVSTTTDSRQLGSAAASAFSFDDDEFDDWDPAGSGLADSPAAAPSQGAAGGSSFFDEDELPPAPVSDPIVPQQSTGGGRRSSGGGMVKVGAGVMVLGALAVGAYFVVPMVTGGSSNDATEGTGEVVVVQQAEPAAAAAATLGSLSELDAAGPAQLREYINSASIGASSALEDRSKAVIAQALLVAYLPEESTAANRMLELAAGLVVEDGQSTPPIVALAQGASAAIAGNEEGAEVLTSVRDPEFAPLARLFEGLAVIQRHRGVSYAAAAAPVVEPVAEGSAAVVPAEGSAAAAVPMEGSAAAEGSTTAEGSGAPTPVAVPVVAAAPALVPVIRPALDRAVTRPLDAALASAPRNAAILYWSAWTNLETSQASGAVQRLTTLVEFAPDHVPGNVLLALSLLRAGDLAAADTRIQRVIDELEESSGASERAMTYIASAEISIARMQTQLAIESLLSALQADPRNRDALRLLGEQFFASGQYQRAIEYFQSNAELAQDDPEAIVALVRAQLGLGQLDEAEAALNPAIVAFPQDGRFPYYMGRIAEERAEFDEARAYLTQAAAIDQNYYDPLLRLAFLAYRENEFAQAQAHLAEIPLDQLDSASWASEIGKTYLLIGETNRAVGAFRRALEIDQTHPGARINLAEYYLTINQETRALDEVELMISSGVDTPVVRYIHARALIGIGRYSEALEDLTALVNADTDNADYLFALGEAHFGDGDYQNARRRFTEAYEVMPSLAEALYYIGRCDIELGAINEAISSLTTVSHRSVRGEYHYWLGVALERGSQTVQAFTEYTRAINDDVGWTLENPEVYFQRAQIFRASGANTNAFRDLRVLLTLRPRHVSASRVLGQLYFDERKFEEAIRWMEHSLSIDPDQPAVRYYVGLAHMEKDPRDPVASLASLERARDEGYGATRPEIYQRLGYLYRDSGRTAEAIGSLQTYLEAPTLAADERRETQNEIARLRNNR
jgi:tetratricopeptide (TPR) repeat protein